jgi:hypothetical protein
MSIVATYHVWHIAALIAVVGCALSAGKGAAAEPLPQVTLKTTKGDVVIELYEDEARTRSPISSASWKRSFTTACRFIA